MKSELNISGLRHKLNIKSSLNQNIFSEAEQIFLILKVLAYFESFILNRGYTRYIPVDI